MIGSGSYGNKTGKIKQKGQIEYERLVDQSQSWPTTGQFQTMASFCESSFFVKDRWQTFKRLTSNQAVLSRMTDL